MSESYGKQSSTEGSFMATDISNTSPPPPWMVKHKSRDRIHLPQPPYRLGNQGLLPPIHDSLTAALNPLPQQTPRSEVHQQDEDKPSMDPAGGLGANAQALSGQAHPQQGTATAQYPTGPNHGQQQQQYYQDAIPQPPQPSLRMQHPQSSYLGQVPNPPGMKAKRKRASPQQIALLNQIFEYTFFPSTELRNAIGKELNMAPRTVQIWFQNRRQSWRAQKNRDGVGNPLKSNDHERGGWEVLRSFQSKRATGEIQEYDYLSCSASGSSMPSMQQDPRGQSDVFSIAIASNLPQPYPPAAVSSNTYFNAQMSDPSVPMPHAPHNSTHQQTQTMTSQPHQHHQHQQQQLQHQQQQQQQHQQYHHHHQHPQQHPHQHQQHQHQQTHTTSFT